jgi:thiamine transport system ATP-binding protein
VSLALEGVDVGLDGRPIVRDVDLAVAGGERLAVLGPSGSGKSTLLRVATGLLRPSRGRVLLEGRDVTDEPPHRRGIGLVFQDAALFPHRDVAGNVGFGPRVAGLPAAERDARVREALALVGLAGAERRDVATLSGGEAQRVALARALAPRPGVLLLDEPLGALDGPLRERLQTDLRALFEALALTVVHVTHDVGEAFALGDRVAILRDGRVALVAPPDELWARPADDWVARFLGMRNVAVDGATATVTRPEAVRLVPGDRAVVVATERDGPVVRVRVHLDDDSELEALATGLDHPRPGDRVGLEIDPGGVVEVRAFEPPADDEFGEAPASTPHQRHGGENHG